MKRLAALLLPLAVAPLPAAAPADEPIAIEVARVVASYPHDPQAFTQGLFIDRGELFESTGMEGRSSVRQVDLTSGKVLKIARLGPSYFGEGVAPWKGQLISLTWQNGMGFRWDRKSFKPHGSFRYDGEGWGLTSNGKELVMSDGTDQLRFIDPRGFRELRRVSVTVQGKPLRMLNELEWIDGQVFANIWMTAYVVRIDPVSGKVRGVIDVSELRAQAGAFGNAQVANGIAWDSAQRKLYMTGKEWPRLFEVRLEPRRAG